MEGDCVRIDGSKGNEDYLSIVAARDTICVDECKILPNCFGFHFENATSKCHIFTRSDIKGSGQG